MYESDFEETTIERLCKLGYNYLPAHEIYTRSNLKEVVLKDKLESFLSKQYPSIPAKDLSRLTSLFMSPDGLTTELRNEGFHDMLVKGIYFSYEVGNETTYLHAYPIDWRNTENNDFTVVNQLAIEGRMSRRPDIIVYINGFPLVLFELKSPYKENATVEDAYTQTRNYTYDISQLFNFNAFCIISDGSTTLHGMPNAPFDYYAAWKSIDGKNIDDNIANSMRTLIEGLFPKERLLHYIRHFIFFVKEEEKKIKIGAKYHQYFGIKFAVEEAVRATRPQGDRKIGVIWHTQGSGKSFSMLFFAGILIRHPDMDNPTIVIQVDRADLDTQLYETFVSGFGLVGHVKQASTTNELRELLSSESGQIIFSTIEKFRLKEAEGEHPVLSERRNIVVIADEAHRTQYNDTGFAGHLKTALPNASHIGFTGTPVDMMGRSTQEVFGHLIHTYDMLQAVKDKATVPIYYESRLIPLDITNENIDEEYKNLLENTNWDDEFERHRAKWTALEKVARTPKRLETLAKDILEHFSESALPDSKGMIVCMSREICAALYQHLKDQPGCPEVEVVMTGDVSKDSPTWREIQPGSRYSHIKTREEQEEVKARLRDPEDPLKFIIVRDMWLTGTDIKPLTFLYVDKPMKGHNLMQAIARVNRVFPGKEAGKVVDFIGISTSLKEATSKYTQSGGEGKPAFDIQEAIDLFMQNLEVVREYIPSEIDMKNWRALPKVEREDWIADLVNTLLSDQKEDFLNDQLRLEKSHLLVKNQAQVKMFANEVLLYNILKVQIRKITAGPKGSGEGQNEIVNKISQLVDESLSAKEAIDIFEIAGIEKPDISILDEAFLADLTKKKHIDLRLKLLHQLLADEIKVRLKRNLKKQKELSKLLEKTLNEYHNRVIQAADLIRFMMEIKNRTDEEKRTQQELNLSDEEMAFYHIVTNMQEASFENQFIADLIHKIVKAMKKELQVDWTNPHRQDILAKVNLAIKSVLMKEKIKGEQLRFLTNAIVEEAKSIYKDWPLDA